MGSLFTEILITSAVGNLTTTVDQLDNTSLALQQLAMNLSNSLSGIATDLDYLKSNCSMSSACNDVPSGNSIRIHNSLNSTNMVHVTKSLHNTHDHQHNTHTHTCTPLLHPLLSHTPHLHPSNTHYILIPHHFTLTITQSYALIHPHPKQALNLTSLKDNLQDVDSTIATIIQEGNITIANISDSIKQWVNSSQVASVLDSKCHHTPIPLAVLRDVVLFPPFLPPPPPLPHPPPSHQLSLVLWILSKAL